MREPLRSRKGFTLIELMIVVVIIGILAALAIPRFTGAANNARQSEAEGILKSIHTLQETHFERNNVYAVSAAALATVGYEAPVNLQHFAPPAFGGTPATNYTVCMAATSPGVVAMTISGTRPEPAATDGRPVRLAGAACP